ncbi:hypothetical protein QFC19_004472 [Naganishia cerealis]|uniref:Uncharacterized protein n=1 Tax=Naganishia cerealis TaxID=610337 RepID=A0ACC2VVD1_9TREE|nr:hypothetical protein QFC19_004472 [Naganishia cerealis]
MQSAFRAEEQRRYEFDVARQKKQATLQRERARAGLAVSEDPIAEVQQPRIRLHREEQEVAVGMRLRPTWSRDWTTMTLKPDSLEEGEVQALIDLVNREVGDNQKFYLNKRFCLKRYSESSAATVQPGCIVYDDPHQDVSMFKYPITPSTQGERRMMDYMSCCMSSGKGVYNWINALGSSIANRDQDGQPFSTEIKLYLIHRPMNPEEIREPVSGFARFFPNRTCRNTEFQGIWTSLRIGIDLELFAFPAKLYQTPSQPSMMAQRRTILQHLYPAEVSTEAYDLTNSSKMIDLEEFYAKLLPSPSQSSRSMNTLQPAEMRTPLLPFQRRSIAWLLQRERASNTEQIFSYRSETWEKMTMGQHAAAIHVGYSRLTGKALPIEAFPEWISETENAAGDIQDDFAEDKDEFGLGAVRGSMLCDEMGQYAFKWSYVAQLKLIRGFQWLGLGKTLEVIALIMLNRTQKESVVSAVNYDQALEMEVTKATLIVIPETLIGQWRQELKQYAPTLKVMVYEGWKSLLQPMNAHAQGKHAQGKRKRAVEYDEVVPYKQLVDSWMHEVGNADVVLTTFGTVQMDWAVAPPPVKRARRSCASYVEKVRPLSALLLCHWHRVAIDEIQELDIATASKAANMIKTIKRDYSLAISGTPAKTSVEDLASSLVFLGVTMPTQVWNKIITPAYSNAFHAIFSNIAIRHVKSGLSAQEMNIPSQHRFLVPVKLSSIEWAYYKETYEANIDRIQRSERGYTDPAMLRNVLHVLRMVSSHIQVGLLGPNPNANGSRAVRLRLDNRIMPILDALQRMEEDAEAALFSSFIEMSRQQIKRAMLLVFQSSKNWKASVRIYSHLAHQLKDLDTRLAQLPADRESPEFNTGDQEGEDEPSNGLLALGLRRHALRLLEHEIAFRLGDVYSSKDVEIEDRSQQEDSWYSTAARLRSELLNSSAKSANDHRSRLTAVLRRSEVHDFGEMEIEYPGQLGLLSQRVQEPLNLRIDCLNDNAEFLWNTRAKIITALMEAVESDGSGEKDYQQTLQEQHDLEAYMWIYQAALADRTEFLVEERNALAVQADRAEAVRQAEAEAEAMVLEDPEASAANKEVNIRDSLVKQRNDIRNAAQKGISLKAAYIGLNGTLNYAGLLECQLNCGSNVACHRYKK